MAGNYWIALSHVGDGWAARVDGVDGRDGKVEFAVDNKGDSMAQVLAHVLARIEAVDAREPEGKSGRRATHDAAAVLRELVDALPTCAWCTEPATRADGRGGPRCCDAHGQGVRDYPRAAALRRARKVLERMAR